MRRCLLFIVAVNRRDGHLFHAQQNSKITYRPHRPETSGEAFLYVILLKPYNNETIFVDFPGSSAI